MPQVIAAFVVEAFVTVAGTVVGGALAVGFGYLVTGLAVNYALGTLSKILAGSDHFASTQTGQEFTLRETVGARTICYGQLRTSGVQVYEYTSGA